jgi:hypothetical protein
MVVVLHVEASSTTSGLSEQVEGRPRFLLVGPLAVPDEEVMTVPSETLSIVQRGKDETMPSSTSSGLLEPLVGRPRFRFTTFAIEGIGSGADVPVASGLLALLPR